MKNTFFTLLITVAANVALTGCSVFEGKQAVDTKNTPARAYVAAPGQTVASNDNRLMLVTPQNNASMASNMPTTTPSSKASAADLANIETAAGPGMQAPAQAQPVIIDGGKRDEFTRFGTRMY